MMTLFPLIINMKRNQSRSKLRRKKMRKRTLVLRMKEVLMRMRILGRRMMKRLMNLRESLRKRRHRWQLVKGALLLDHKSSPLLVLRSNLLLGLNKDLLLDHRKHNLLLVHRKLNQWQDHKNLNLSQDLNKLSQLQDHRRVVPHLVDHNYAASKVLLSVTDQFSKRNHSQLNHFNKRIHGLRNSLK